MDRKVCASAARYHVCVDHGTNNLSRRPSQEELDAVTLSGRDLTGVVLRKINLEGRDLRGISFADAVLNDVNFDNAQLEGANFSGAELDGSRFVGADLQGASLDGVRGESVDFSNAQLQKTNFSDSDLGNVTFTGAVLDGAVLERARWVQVVGEGLSARGVVAKNWVLDDAKLAGSDFEEADCFGCVWQFVDVDGGRLVGVDFRKARLHKSTIDRADLDGIRADGARVRGVAAESDVALAFENAGAVVGGFWSQLVSNLRDPGDAEARKERLLLGGYWLVSLWLSYAMLQRTGFVAAVMTLAVAAGGAVGLRYWMHRGRRELQRDNVARIGPGAQLQGAELRGANLAGRDLSGADLTGALLQGADLRGANLSGTTLNGARLDRCRLSQANLENACLDGATLDDARLDDASLLGVSAASSRWIGADLRRVVVGGTVFRSADLSAARLTDVDLKDSDLTGAVLEQTDLAGALLDDAIVRGMEAEGALGLTSEALDALASRGARVNVLSIGLFSWILAREGRPKRLARLAALLLIGGIGTYLVSHYLSDANLSKADQEGLAQDAASRGDVAEALGRYQTLLGQSDLSSEKMVYLFEMSALVSEVGRHDEAIEYLQSAVAFAEAPADQAEIALRMAKQHGLSGAVEEEMSGYEAIVQRDDLPADLTARALVALSEATARMGFPQRALELHEEVLERYAGNPTVVLRVNMAMAELLSAKGDYGEALAAIQRISGFKEKLDDLQKAELLVLEASLYEEQGLNRKSLDIYRELKRRYPKYRDLDGEVLLSMARLTARQGKAKEAKILLTELIERGVARPAVMSRSRLLLGRIAEDEGNFDEAVQVYREVLSSDALDRDAQEAARIALANALLASGSGDASAVLEDMVKGGEPELASQALLGRAHAALDIGDIDEARGIAQRVLTDFQAIPDAQLAAKTLLAQALVAEGDYPKAVRAYRELLESAQSFDEKVVLRSSIADALLQAGRIKEAERDFESLLKTDPDHPEAGPLARLGLARVAEAKGDHEKARRLYRAVAEKAEDFTLRAAGLEALALAHLESGQDQEAMAVYRKFLESLPDGHDAAFSARLAMAGILVRRGDNAQAQIQYETLSEKANTPGRKAEIEFALGELKEQSGDLSGALAAYTAIRGMVNLPLSRRLEAGLGLARVQLALGQPQLAVDVLDTMETQIGSGGARVSLLQVKIQALQALGKTAEADAISATLLSLAGDDQDAVMVAQLELARNKANNGDFEEAVALYAALGEQVSDRPTQAAMQISIAQVYAQAGDAVAARSSYEAVLQRFGNLEDARFECQMGLANVDRMEGKPAAAVLRYLELKTTDVGSDIWRMQQLAQTYWEMDQPENARSAFEAIQERYPTQPAAVAAAKDGLANIARAEGELELARGLFSQVAELSGDPTQREWAKLNVASILAELGKVDDAFFAYRTAASASSDPEVVLQAKLGMSAVYQEKGRFDQALEILEDVKVQDLGPAWAAALTQAQVASERALGRLENAQALWKKLLEDWTDHDEAKSQAHLGLAEIALERGETEAALGLFGKVHKESGDRFFQAQAQIGLGRVHVQDGNADLAADELESVVENFPDQPEMVSLAQDTLNGM